MTEDDFNAYKGADPELRRAKAEPRGVLQRNLKTLVYLGAALLVIVAAIISSTGNKTQGTKNLPPQPMIQDNTDNNVRDLKNQLQAEQQKQPPQTAYPNPDYAPGGRYFGCVPGQICTPEMQQQDPQVQQLTPEQQQEQQLAAKDRELAYNARFASNIAYSRPPEALTGQVGALPANSLQSADGSPDPKSSLIAPHGTDERLDGGEGHKRAPEVNVD